MKTGRLWAAPYLENKQLAWVLLELLIESVERDDEHKRMLRAHAQLWKLLTKVSVSTALGAKRAAAETLPTDPVPAPVPPHQGLECVTTAGRSNQL